MIKHVTKKNGPRPERIIALAVFSALFVAAIVTGIFAAGLLRKLGSLQDGDDPSILGSQI